jgi:hypothetical protein
MSLRSRRDLVASFSTLLFIMTLLLFLIRCESVAFTQSFN